MLLPKSRVNFVFPGIAFFTRPFHVKPMFRVVSEIVVSANHFVLSATRAHDRLFDLTLLQSIPKRVARPAGVRIFDVPSLGFCRSSIRVQSMPTNTFIAVGFYLSGGFYNRIEILFTARAAQRKFVASFGRSRRMPLPMPHAVFYFLRVYGVMLARAGAGAGAVLFGVTLCPTAVCQTIARRSARLTFHLERFVTIPARLDRVHTRIIP